MVTTARAMTLEGPRQTQVREFPLPDITAEEAILRVELAGVCGSDAKLYLGTTKRTYPFIPGHEILGFIHQAGEAFAKRHGLREGDRVVVEASVPCGACSLCMQGFYKMCKLGQGYGFGGQRPPILRGSFSEYMYLAPNSIVHKISPDLSAEAAVVASACLGNGIRWVRTVGGASIGKSVVIQGTGPQGLAAVVAAKESGASPIIVTGLSRDAARLALARELGADVTIDIEREDAVEVVRTATSGALADTVLDVTGNERGIPLSIDLVKPLGTLVLAGTIPVRGPVGIVTNDIVNKEIRLQGVYGHSIESTTQAIHLAESGKYPLEKLISHTFSLEDAGTGLAAVSRLLEDINPIKVAIKP